MSIERCSRFFADLELQAPRDGAADLLLGEIRTRLSYLAEVGLGYLNLDRQSRTLSGGEVQRINLTTALGTSLVNTLFVLDEPSIGLHARDVGRITAVMRRLCDAGNTLVVVEHDPKIMLASDRVLDIGPGPGERGGEVVFFGSMQEFAKTDKSLTADYLFGRRRVGGAAPAADTDAQPRAGGALRIEGACLAQFALHRRGDPAAPPGLRDRSQRLRQVDARAGRAVPRVAARAGAADRKPGRAPLARGQRVDRRGDHGRPEFDRPYDALESREFRRRVRRGPPTVRTPAGGARAQVHRRHVQLQRRHRAVPGLRRQRLRARRDAISLRRLPALSRLRRPALPRRGARGEAPRRRRCAAVDRRRARSHRVGGTRDFRRRSRDRAAPRASCRRRSRLLASGATGADALRRRGAAPQARGASRRTRGRDRRAHARLAVHLRRADDGTALPRHCATHARVSPPDRSRSFAARHRAQHRRHSRRRLDHRPRARRRRRRRHRGLRGHAGRPHGRSAIAYRPRARRGRGAGGGASLGRSRAAASRRPAGAADRYPRRARAQSQERRRCAATRAIHGDHRSLRQRQEHLGVRHTVRRGPAPLSRIAERLCAPVRAAGLAARRGRDPRDSADRRHRAAHEPRRAQEHGRDPDRDLPFPAPAVRQARRPVLPGVRGADRTAARGCDRCAPADGVPRQTHRTAGAVGRRAQGPVHGARQVGARQGLRDALRRRRAPADREMAAARSVRRTPHRAPGRRADRRERARTGIARSARGGAAIRPRRGSRRACRRRRRARRAADLFHAPGVPVLRHGISANSIRGCSRSTRGTDGARAVSAPASN